MNNQIKPYFNSNQKDYTFNDYNNLKVNNQTAIQCLFNGSTFNNCIFNECNFNRSDFEGMRDTDLSFKKTSFHNADIKSNVWKNCVFCECDFSDAYFADNEFINCIFEKCIFHRGIALKNTFNYCTFDSSDLSESTFTKNIFFDTSFLNTNLGNCSFYKQILNKCIYTNVSMNIDSLGQVYGLSQDSIKSINYIFLGKPLGNFTNDNISELIDAFNKKKWYYEIINLKYNLGLLTNYDYINLTTEHFIKRFESSSIINADEIEFYIMILDYLYEHESLPFFSVVYAYNSLGQVLGQINNSNRQKIKEIIVNLQFMYENMVSRLIASYEKEIEISQNNNSIDIMLHYDNMQVIDFSELINLYVSKFELSSTKEAHLVSIKKGTFIEYIATTVLGVFALKAIVYGIKGILLEVIEIKDGIKHLSDKKNRYPEIIIKDGAEKRSIVFKNIDSINKNINKDNINVFSIISKLLDQVIFKK